MNWQSVTDRKPRNTGINYTHYPWVCLVFFMIANANAADSSWTSTVTPQAYWQTYDGTTTRDNSFNAGIYIMGDHLESSNIGAGYSFTLVNLNNNANIMEHLFYLTGRHHWFLDALPGKLTLRMDFYGGNSTLEYRVNNPPSGMKKKLTSGSTGTRRESTTITAFQPVISFINYSKTLYLDIGYAHSEYDNNPDAKVDQVTPTVGFGWNESYDWLQLRAYLIDLDENNGLYDDDHYDALELSYTHWFTDEAIPRLEFMRLTALAGERVLAVDPDSATVHSTGDKQTGGLAASAQWKMSEDNRLLFLVSAGQYENDIVADKYNSLLFYLHFRHQW